MTPIRLMLVDDHTVVRDGLASMLSSQEDFEVAGHANNGREAVERVAALQPDVILMDLRMPEMGGVEAMHAISSERPDTRFIVLTTYDDDDHLFQAIEAGAKGFLLKDTSREDLFEAVRAVHRGESGIEPGVAARVLDRFVQLSREETHAPLLSERELEVLQLMAKGSANKEIAAMLTISDSTVKTHIANIFQKLDVRGRTEAVTHALQAGIIKL